MEPTNHQVFAENVEAYLREQEYVNDVTRTDTDTITYTTDGIPTQLIIRGELSTIDKPGVTLQGIEAKADPHFDNQLVVPTNKAAAQLLAYLSTPVQTVGRRGMRCYVTSTPLEVNGHTVVCPSTDNPEWWYSDSKYRLGLKTASKTVSISMDVIEIEDRTSVESIPFPRIITTEDELIVEDETGTTLETYDSRAALMADWTPVRVPYVPIQWDILRMPVHCFGGTLVEYRPSYVWNDDSPLERAETVLEEILTTKTVFRPGAEIDVESLYQRVQNRHTYDFDHSVPDLHLFSIALARTVETTYRQNPWRKVIPHREWVDDRVERHGSDAITRPY